MSSWPNGLPYCHADATRAGGLAEIPVAPNVSQIYVHTVVPPAGAITVAGSITTEVLGPSFFAHPGKSAFPAGEFTSSGGGSYLDHYATLSEFHPLEPIRDPLAPPPITGYHSKKHEPSQFLIAERRPLKLLLEPAPDHLLQPPADEGEDLPRVDQPQPFDHMENLIWKGKGKGIADWDVNSELEHRAQVLNQIRWQLESQRESHSHSMDTHFDPEIQTYIPAAPHPPNTRAQVAQQVSFPAPPEEPKTASTQVLLPDSSSVGLELLFRNEGAETAITDEPKVHPSQVEFHKHPVVRSKALLSEQSVVTKSQGPKMSLPPVNIIPPTPPGNGNVLHPPRGQFPPLGGQNGSYRRPVLPLERVQEIQEPQWSAPFALSLRVLDNPVPDIDGILSKNTHIHEAVAGATPTTKASSPDVSWKDVKLPTVSPRSFAGLSERPRTSEENRMYNSFIGGQLQQNFRPGQGGTAAAMAEQQATRNEVLDSPMAGEKKLSIIERRLANQRAGTRRSARFRGISRGHDD